MNRSHALFSKEFRSRFSEKLMELGNIVAGVMVFGQFLPNTQFSRFIFISGVILMVVCYVISFFVSL